MTETATIERYVGAVDVADTDDAYYTSPDDERLVYVDGEGPATFAKESADKDWYAAQNRRRHEKALKAQRNELNKRVVYQQRYPGPGDPDVHHKYHRLDATGKRLYRRSDMETPAQREAHARRALITAKLNYDIDFHDHNQGLYYRRRREWLEGVKDLLPPRDDFPPPILSGVKPRSNERLAPWRWNLMTGTREKDPSKSNSKTRQREIMWNGEVVDITRYTTLGGIRIHVPDVIARSMESAIERSKEFADIKRTRTEAGRRGTVWFKGKRVKPKANLEIFRENVEPELRERLVMQPTDTYTKASAGSEGASEQDWVVRLHPDDRSHAALYGHDPSSYTLRSSYQAPAPDEDIRGVTTAGLDVMQAYLDKGKRLGPDQRKAAFTFLVRKVRLYRKMLDLSSEDASRKAGLNADRLGELERKLDGDANVMLQRDTVNKLRELLTGLVRDVALRHQEAIRAGSLDPEWSELAERYARLRPELERMDPGLIHDFRKRRDARTFPHKVEPLYRESYSMSGEGDGAITKVRRTGLLVKGLRQNRALQGKGDRVPPEVIAEHIGDAFWALVEPPTNFDYFGDTYGGSFASWVVKVVRRTGGITTDGVQVGSRVKRDANRESQHMAPPEEPDYSVYGSEWAEALEGAAFELSDESGVGTLEVAGFHGTPGYGGPDDLYEDCGIPPGPIYHSPGEAMLFGIRYAATSRKGDLAWKFLADLHHYSTSKGKAALSTKEPIPASGPSPLRITWRAVPSVEAA
jgi:hypothetical protein